VALFEPHDNNVEHGRKKETEPGYSEHSEEDSGAKRLAYPAPLLLAILHELLIRSASGASWDFGPLPCGKADFSVGLLKIRSIT
jgi:hypothetical protein